MNSEDLIDVPECGSGLNGIPRDALPQGWPDWGELKDMAEKFATVPCPETIKSDDGIFLPLGIII